MMPFTADVTDLAREVERQFLLDIEVPVLVVAVLPVPVDSLRREELVLRRKEWIDGIGEVRSVRVGDRVTGHGTLHWIAEVVVLVCTVIHPEAGTYHGRLPAEQFGRPGNAD